MKEFDMKPFELRAAFWDEFRDWWNKDWRDLFGEPLTMSARYEYRDKRWREFKDRMITEEKLSASSSWRYPSP